MTDRIRETLAQVADPLAVLESLFALSPVAFQIYEASGRSLLVNAAFVQLFGSEPPPEYNVLKDEIAARQGVLGLIHRAFAGETVATPVFWYDPRELEQVKVAEGNRVAIQATFFPLFDGARKVTHVAIAFKDLTAELVQREQLEEERALLADLIDQVAEGVVMVDAGGVVRLVNRAMRDLGVRTGVPAQRWSDEFGLTRADGSPLPLEESTLWQALQGRSANAVVYQRDGKGARALNARAVPLRRRDGSLRGAVVTTRDETERLRQEHEAEENAHFREQFIAILGHDLRSPLTAILASAGLILRLRELPVQAVSAATRVAGAAERMGRMISDLLDFTQARLGGGLAVHKAAADLREVAEEVVDEVRAAHPGRVVELSVEGETRGSFDADRAAQLLSNLLQNALAYSPAAAPVQVELRGRELAVHNAGPVIPAEERATLFDPFRRGRAAPPESRGLGLGLYIVQQIARAHGGDVTIESAEGRTTFRANLG